MNQAFLLLLSFGVGSFRALACVRCSLSIEGAKHARHTKRGMGRFNAERRRNATDLLDSGASRIQMIAAQWKAAVQPIVGITLIPGVAGKSQRRRDRLALSQ